ncbi:phosphotransferase [Terrabacter carboxydivorans]|uniref:Aminoglycoside phosphotransferase domain-containing protein n=1 Tax=Terrabacter carboxydivorans TaxID=619730 RepID=A0ABN3LY85_9MICO
MTRSPLFLAALASSAVPGLDPVTVEGVASEPGDLFEIAYVQDSQDRRWVVKAPCTQAAGAMLDDISPLSGLLGRRLEIAMPMVRGFAPVPEGRAAVYLRVPGRPLDLAGLEPGPLAAEVGRTLAHIHNVEHLLFEEAGRPAYDAEAHRRRRLSELDRAAATGHVPTGLLTRWEHALEDVSMWRFAPTSVHGTFTGANVLASFDDDDDSSTGHIRGVLAWEESRIGDPADDFAELASVAPPGTVDAVLEAYAASRIERPDVHLVRRARLAAEMAPLRRLLHALASGQLEVVERTAEELRDLDARVEADDRRHAREDAERSERTRRAQDRSSGLDPDDPEQPQRPATGDRPEYEWDATQPHVPFPMLGETQAISMHPLLEGTQAYAVSPPVAFEADEADGVAVDATPAAEQQVQAAGWSTPSEAIEHTPAVEVPGREGVKADDEDAADAVRGAEDVLRVETGRQQPGHAEPVADFRPAPVRSAGNVRGVETQLLQPRQAEPVEDSQPVPVVAPDSDASPFEIDEVEALPEETSGVLDLHEGASDFIPVTGHDHPGHARPGDR